MPELDRLTLSLANASKGKANLAGLDEQYDESKRLRDSQSAQINQFGTVSPFAVLADVVNSSRGRQGMREVEPQRSAARTAISESENALPLYQAKMAQQKTAYDKTQDAQAQENTDRTFGEGQRQFGLSQAAATQRAADKLAAEQARHKKLDDRYTTEQGQRSTEAKYYTNDDTGEAIKAYRTKGGDLIDSEGNKIDSLKGWSVDPTATKIATNFGYGYDKQDKQAVDAALLMGKADRIGRKVNALSPQARQELDSFMIRSQDFLLDTFTPQKANALIKSELSGYSDEAKNFLESLARMSAEERHELFGAALTEGEELSGEKFLAFVNGQPLSRIMNRAKDVYDSNFENLKTLDAVFKGDKYQRIVKDADWKAFTPAAAAQDSPGQKDPNEMTLEELQAELGG